MGVSYYVREVDSRRKHSPDAKYVYIAESTYDPKTRRTRIRNLLSLGRKDVTPRPTPSGQIQRIDAG